jgi:hypothetical protein
MHNITHLRVAAGYAVTTANANLIANSLGVHVTADLAPHLSTGTSFLGVSLRDLRTIDQAFVDSSITAIPGTAVGDPLPANVSAVITLRTALAGRRNRGRFYVIPFDEASNDSTGRIGTAAKAALDSFATNLPGSIEASGGTMAILNRPVFNKADCTVLRQPGLVNVTQAVVRDTRWDSQRRRLGRS